MDEGLTLCKGGPGATDDYYHGMPRTSLILRFKVNGFLTYLICNLLSILAILMNGTLVYRKDSSRYIGSYAGGGERSKSAKG